MPAHERIPLFPLSIVLFPQEVLPLHIFEQRYKELVRNCLDKDAPFGIVGMDGAEMESVGCTARIRNVVQEYEDDTFDIETVGEARFHVESVHDGQSYATAEVTLLKDVDEDVAITDRERLVAQHMKLLELLGESIRPNAYTDEHLLSFRIGAVSGLDFAQRQQLLEINSEAARITHLVNHLSGFIPRVQSVKERRDRIQSNGHFN
ncbi:MAG: LON peptidase substrate-binding domain-containing protein [Rhodothermales bacterium]